MNFIDLFAGAGGLSEGFLREGYDAVAHIEMNTDAAYTLKTRACHYYLLGQNNLAPYYQYLRGKLTREQLYTLVPDEITNCVLTEAISDSSIGGIFDMVDTLLASNSKWNNQVDIVIGGPPCQAYSLVGRAVKEDNMENDPRNFLYRLYCRFLNRYRPKMFVFENVPGLLTAQGGRHFANLQRYMRHIGYHIEVKELNAKDFGVLQNRKRIIIIGWQREAEHHYPEFVSVKHVYEVNDLLRDLPAIQAGETKDHYRSVQPSAYLNEYEIRNTEDVLTWHTARPHIERDKEIYKRVITAWNNGHRRLKYDELPAELKTHRNVTSFVDRFKVVEGDTQTCHTMMAHIAKDGHYFIHPDIRQARSITVREAARIQSFPDNYFFEGSRTAAFTQIGNAVPPLMAQAIARELLAQLD